VGPDEVRRLYDEDYAAGYDARFLTNDFNGPDTAFELELLGGLLKSGPEWLDAACGTGYFLRHFPEVRRIGADLSPAMLARARQDNPGADFALHDLREPRPEWTGRFGLVSCMWYAYTLVDGMAEALRLIDNLADWTSPSGTLFLPVADARLISRSQLSYEIGPTVGGGRILITGITWSFVEDDGRKTHAHLVTPQLEVLIEQLEQRFSRVEVVRYPFKPDGVSGRPALIASGKR